MARRLLSENNEDSTSHHHSNNYGSISSLSLPWCACGWIDMILLCQSVSHLNASQREKQTNGEAEISLIPIFCFAMACINEHFVVWLLSAAVEEDDCDSPYFSHHSLTTGRINGKAADYGTRQPSWVKDDSALFPHCRLIKHQKECLMSSVVAIMHRICYAVLSKQHLKRSLVEPVSGYCCISHLVFPSTRCEILMFTVHWCDILKGKTDCAIRSEEDLSGSGR